MGFQSEEDAAYEKGYADALEDNENRLPIDELIKALVKKDYDHASTLLLYYCDIYVSPKDFK
jgi:hypothetical protein